MEKNQKYNNNIHLQGYINDVRMNEVGNGRTAINLDVATEVSFVKKNDKGEDVRVRPKTYHDVVLFAEDKALIEKFSQIAADVKNNNENRDVEGFKPTAHLVSLDGLLLNKTREIEYLDENNEPKMGTYRTVQVFVLPEKIAIDQKRGEKEVRNYAQVAGNIMDIKVYPDKKFATLQIMNHYKKDDEHEFETALDVRISGSNPYTKKAYESLEKNEIGIGDFIRVGGQMKNNRVVNNAGKTRYGMIMDMGSFELLRKREAKAETAAEEQKAAPKQEPEKEPKKATSKKAAPKQEPKAKKETKKGIRR